MLLSKGFSKDTLKAIAQGCKDRMLLLNAPEEKTVQAAIAGDSEAFEALFRNYYPMLCSYAYRLCLNQADAQNITQVRIRGQS